MVFSMWVILATTVILLLLISYLRVLYNYMRKVEVIVTSTHSKESEQNSVKTVKYAQAPGPIPWPVLGNLALLGRYEVPFQGFTELAKEYGDGYSLTLGTTRCFIVNNLDLIREVLNQNGKFFGGRPDFLRYHKLFGGDRNNSLALCDWSQLQQKRRNLARRHCSPRDSSSYFTKMSTIGCIEAREFMDQLRANIVPGEPFAIKQLIQQSCANMFSQYMCSTRFDYLDTDFQRIVEHFDEIFWEINQGYAVDFLPFLSPFYKNHMKKVVHWSTEIRKFILERVINDREQSIDVDEPEKDFTDALLKSLAEDPETSRNTIIFMLEDFLGGHSAVGNLVMITLALIAKNPHVGARIQRETDHVTNHGTRAVNLIDMDAMPYTVATIFEVLRYSSSPIVPHVATEDAVISGFGVTKGTVVFINNYNLNTSDKYWEKPELFNPERFLETGSTAAPNNSSKKQDSHRRHSETSDSGVEFEKEKNLNTSASETDKTPNITVIKNLKETSSKTLSSKRAEAKAKCVEVTRVKKNVPHFLPFSIGKRTCIGQNLVRGFAFILLANIVQKYDVGSKNITAIKIIPACVALPTKTFPLMFTERSAVIN